MLNILKLFIRTHVYICIKTIFVYKPHENLRKILFNQIAREVCVGARRVVVESCCRKRCQSHCNFVPWWQIECSVICNRLIPISGSTWRNQHSTLSNQGEIYCESYITFSSNCGIREFNESIEGEEISSLNWSREFPWRYIHGTSNVNSCYIVCNSIWNISGTRCSQDIEIDVFCFHINISYRRRCYINGYKLIFMNEIQGKCTADSIHDEAGVTPKEQ